ncbi:hypothetical protein [Ureibacillus manganicus]|uniref:Uncharacterized protein n=1 Tax=Ureibacillus manganicus DSM 26584 TaxID=1384049 RepID=A0A0A3HSW2_9BACL|nr:hypothetical protein [Ureibacillus manganicus]KGR75686.1 hypothetical protein CD29_17795 [Ureibacillus manganicus DSM 26584]
MMAIFTMFILIAFLAIVVMALTKLTGSKLWTFTMNQWIVIGFLALGLISMGVLSFTAKEEERLSVEKSKEILEDESQLWNVLLDGETNAHYEGYLQKEWRFEVTSDEFRVIPSTGIDLFKVGVIAERREDPNSNEIFAKTYVIPYQVKGFDFTKKASLDYFEYVDNNLFVNQIRPQEFKFHQFYPGSLILNQINGDLAKEEEYYSFYTGRTILFLNVPSHVNIIDESDFIYYVR